MLTRQFLGSNYTFTTSLGSVGWVSCVQALPFYLRGDNGSSWPGMDFSSSLTRNHLGDACGTGAGCNPTLTGLRALSPQGWLGVNSSKHVSVSKQHRECLAAHRLTFLSDFGHIHFSVYSHYTTLSLLSSRAFLLAPSGRIN